MHVWEQILLLLSAPLIVLLAFVALPGRTGRMGRFIFMIGSLALGWFFFRIESFFPHAGFSNFVLPRDIEICLVILPFFWLVFSVIFAREDYVSSLKRSRVGLLFGGGLAILFFILVFFYPLIILQAAYPDPHKLFVSRVGSWYFLYVIVISALTMINFESTYRASWGIYRRKLRPSVMLIGLIQVSLLLSASLVLLSGEMKREYLAALAGLCVLASLLIAVYYRSYQPQQSGVYVRKHAVYSSVGIIIIGFYLVLAGAIGKIIQIIGGDIKLFISVLGAMVAFLALLALILSRSIKERIKLTIEKTFHSGQMDFEGELATFSEDIATIFDPEELTEKILELLRDRLGIGKLYLFYTDPHQDNLISIFPREKSELDDFKIATNGAFADWIFRHGEAMVMEDLMERLSGSGADIPEFKMLSRLDISITLPLIAKQRLVGVLFLGSKVNKEPFRHQEIQFISSIGYQFSLALFSARLSEELLAARQIESFHKFTTFVMHDLKNSVSMLSMLLQNYEANMDNPEFQKSAITTIDGAVRRMQIVMEKLKSGEEVETFKFSDCNLNEIILALEKRLGLGQQDGIEYSHKLADKALVKGDLEKLAEVVRNLIINALEAMPDGGKLAVKTALDSKRVILEVRDTGVGMTPEFVSKKLFKPFATTKQKGLGIGLFQSKEWIEKMGGKINVRSAPGKGSAISLIFGRKE